MVLDFLAGGSLKVALLQFLLFQHKFTNKPEQVAAVQTAEATGQPASIGKHLYDLWGDVSGLAKTDWNAFKNSSPTTKTIAGLIGLED